MRIHSSSRPPTRDRQRGSAFLISVVVTAAVAAHPVLMERPVVVRGERAAIGRPPEDVQALLG